MKIIPGRQAKTCQTTLLIPCTVTVSIFMDLSACMTVLHTTDIFYIWLGVCCQPASVRGDALNTDRERYQTEQPTMYFSK